MRLDSYYVPFYHYFTGPKLTVTERLVHCTYINYLFLKDKKTKVDIDYDQWKYFYGHLGISKTVWRNTTASLVEKKYITIALDDHDNMVAVRVRKFPDPASKSKKKAKKTERRWVK